MKLKKLLIGIEHLRNFSKTDNDKEILFITSDSRLVKKDSIFVAIEGDLGDGHDYAKQAYENGASYIFTQKDIGLNNQIIVKNTRIAYSILCGNLNDNPAKKLKLIGITGTNGKTTIATVLKNALDNLGYKTGLIGTIENKIGNYSLPAKHTTPDPRELNVLLDKMYRAKCDYVIMETSSHGLSQHRLEGYHFKVGVFTNLSSEHMEYHKNMENYYQAKKILFQNSDVGIVILDDRWGKRLFNEFNDSKEENIILKTFSLKEKEADFFPQEVKKSSTKVEFNLKKYKERFFFPMPGDYSIKNALVVIAVLESLGINRELISNSLSKIGAVAGRTEVIYSGEFTVVRDYAHTSDGLLNLLAAINEFKKSRVLCLFGAPGRRDRSKRPSMGEVVAELSDFFIITSDNPREEDEEQIINEIVEGAKKISPNYEIFTDRYEAIERILSLAKKDDIVILAGKGHEDYQVLSRGTIVFNEKEIVKNILR